VSCVSAGSVIAALDPESYEVVTIGITPDGRWVLPPGDQQLAISDGRLPTVSTGTELAVPGARELVVLEPGQVPRTLAEVDVVFPVLHGPWGEDGTVQGLLELAGVPYVGSGVFASAAAMDKAHAKVLCAAAGLPIGPWHLLRPGSDVPTSLPLELPVFVKPARAGSSLGITRVTRWEDLGAAVEEARRHDPKVVVEQGIAGREIECGVLESLDGPPQGSVPAEVRVVRGHDFYDFEAKYLDDATELDCPADLPADVVAEVQRLAVRAFEALDCAGLARVDFFLQQNGDLVLNEINTMPGFTPVSMFPRMWAESGVPYAELVGRLVSLALRSGTGLR
jgi:D-alanine-D-alanine ligase